MLYRFEPFAAENQRQYLNHILSYQFHHTHLKQALQTDDGLTTQQKDNLIRQGTLQCVYSALLHQRLKLLNY